MYERAKKVRFLRVCLTKSRVIAVAGGEDGMYLVLVGLGGSTFCSCPSYKYRLGLCKHLVAAIRLFTDWEVEVQ